MVVSTGNDTVTVQRVVWSNIEMVTKLAKSVATDLFETTRTDALAKGGSSGNKLAPFRQRVKALHGNKKSPHRRREF